MNGSTITSDLLAPWEELSGQLPPALEAAVGRLREYIGPRPLRVHLFASRPELTAEWQELAAPVFPQDWQFLSRQTNELAAGEPTLSPAFLFDQLCCDAVVVLLPVLHMDSAGLKSLQDLLRLCPPKVYVLLLGFEQISRKVEDIARKRQEASRRFDLPDVQVFACSANPGKGLVTMDEAAREIHRELAAVAADSGVRGRALLALLGEKTRQQVRSLLDDLRHRIRLGEEEKKLAADLAASMKVLAKTLGNALVAQDTFFLSVVCRFTFRDLRHRLESPEGLPANPERWAFGLQTALFAALEQRWGELEEGHPLRLVQPLQNLIDSARGAAAKDVEALIRELGLPAESCERLAAVVAEEEPFAELQRRCREFEQKRPLTPAEIRAILRESCSTFQIVLADLAGRKLPDLWAAKPYHPLPAPQLELPEAEDQRLRRLLHDQTAGKIRELAAESVVGGAIGAVQGRFSQAVEERRKQLVDDLAPQAFNVYFAGVLKQYEQALADLRERLKELSASLGSLP